jgi:hypothetical protein
MTHFLELSGAIDSTVADREVRAMASALVFNGTDDEVEKTIALFRYTKFVAGLAVSHAAKVLLSEEEAKTLIEQGFELADIAAQALDDIED